MRQINPVISSLYVFSMITGIAVLCGIPLAVADNDRERPRYLGHDDKPRNLPREQDDKKQPRYLRHSETKQSRGDTWRGEHHSRPRVIHHGPTYVVPPKRVRHYRNIVVIRPYGHWYYGYGHIHLDDDAYKWLAFTAITLKLLDNLNEQQQREHEAAQVRATTAAIGEKIIWQDGRVSGSVTATRDGNSTTGRYCREFRHEVSIGGKKEQAYGTACRQADGSWEVISTSVAPN